MFFKKYLAALIVFVTAAGSPATAQDVKSPDDVKYALQMLMHITNDFKRQIDRKTYARLPHEHEEFVEGSDALRKAVANDPEPLKQSVETALQAALAAAKDVADKNSSNDEAILRAGHAVMLAKVNAVFGVFPEPLRPDPNFMFTRKPAATPTK